MPQGVAQKQKVVKNEEVKPKVEPSTAVSEVPTLSDILMPAIQVAEQPTTSEQADEGEDVAKLTMSYLMKKDKDKARLVQETIKILPELAKSDNPLAAIMLEKLLEGGGSSGGDLEEFKDLAKAMTYTVVLPELMKDVVRSVKGSGGDMDKTTLILLQALEERDRRLHQMLEELKAERESKLVDEMRKEMYETLSSVVETFSKSIQELQQQILTVAEANKGNNQPSDPFEMFEMLMAYEEKAKQLLEKRGYKILDQQELLDKLSENSKMDVERQIELKKLELQKKELEMKGELYKRVGEAFAKLAENPDNIVRLIQGLIGILKGGPTNEQWSMAMSQVSNPVSDIPIAKESSLPSLDSYLGDAGE